MLPENEKKINNIVSASTGMAFPYEIVEYRGNKLLISRGKLKLVIALTWERLGDQETADMAKEFGVELRKRDTRK